MLACQLSAVCSVWHSRSSPHIASTIVHELSIDTNSKRLSSHIIVLQDFGTQWTNLTEKAGGKVAAFWDFDWGAALTHPDPSKTIDDEVILATVYEESSAMKGPYPGWDKDLHFVRSDDLWDTQHTKLVACGNQFEVIGQRVRSWPCTKFTAAN